MDKNQQKQVKAIHKKVQKEHSDILKDPLLTADEKKSRVESTNRERDAKLAEVLTPEQVMAVKAKDPISWKKTLDKIDKQERSRLKAERDQKLSEVDKQARVIASQQDEVKKQMNDLKRQQKDLDAKQKVLKQQKKEIKAFYK